MIKKYFSYRKEWFFLLFYIAIGVILRIFTSINILPPCLWTSLFGVECPSCGMTRSFISLLQLDFQAAWAYNRGIVVVIPLFLFLIGHDIYTFLKKHNNEVI